MQQSKWIMSDQLCCKRNNVAPFSQRNTPEILSISRDVMSSLSWGNHSPQNNLPWYVRGTSGTCQWNQTFLPVFSTLLPSSSESSLQPPMVFSGYRKKCEYYFILLFVVCEVSTGMSEQGAHFLILGGVPSFWKGVNMFIRTRKFHALLF